MENNATKQWCLLNLHKKTNKQINTNKQNKQKYPRNLK